MKGRYGITSRLEHYGCMTDLLSRAGMLEEAETFIREMPLKPNGAVSGGLCLVNAEPITMNIGEKAAKQLLEIEPKNNSAYVLPSNIFF